MWEETFPEEEGKEVPLKSQLTLYRVCACFFAPRSFIMMQFAAKYLTKRDQRFVIVMARWAMLTFCLPAVGVLIYAAAISQTLWTDS